jgi:Ca2+-binding EF-hand superfamily protein
MLKPRNIVCLLIALSIAPGVVPRTAVAQTKAPVPKPQNKMAIAENEFKQLLLLMDANKNGKISKQEYMKFMEAEFDWFDKNHNGELDVKEVTKPNVTLTHFTSVGK